MDIINITGINIGGNLFLHICIVNITSWGISNLFDWAILWNIIQAMVVFVLFFTEGEHVNLET